MKFKHIYRRLRMFPSCALCSFQIVTLCVALISNFHVVRCAKGAKICISQGGSTVVRCALRCGEWSLALRCGTPRYPQLAGVAHPRRLVYASGDVQPQSPRGGPEGDCFLCGSFALWRRQRSSPLHDGALPWDIWGGGHLLLVAR